jgi:hypothetical protein
MLEETQKGWKDKAIVHYEKFFSLGKDADPGIVEFRDARKRLAGMQVLKPNGIKNEENFFNQRKEIPITLNLQ